MPVKQFILTQLESGGHTLIPLDQIGVVTQAHRKVDEHGPQVRFIPIENQAIVRVKAIDTDITVMHSVEDIADTIARLHRTGIVFLAVGQSDYPKGDNT